MNFYEGITISYDEIHGSGGGWSVRDGKITKMDISPHIYNIVTDSGNTYEIIFHSYIVYEGSPEKKE